MTRSQALRNVRATARGMTLVELMVGMAVGLFVVLVAVAIFISTRSLHSVGSASTRMSENARLAMDVLQTDLRNASFLGCRPLLNDSPIIVLLAGDGGFLSTGPGLRGNRGTGAGFAPALTGPLAALPAASAPNASSDIISVRVPTEMPGLGLVAAMPSTVAAPQVAASSPANTLASGDIVLIASCKASTMFQVTAANPAATGVLSTPSAAASRPATRPTTCSSAFAPTRPSTRWRRATTTSRRARSGPAPIRSIAWSCPERGPIELASGVDRLLVTYGIDGAATAGQQNVDRYAGADGVAAWDKVVSVRLQMLVATAKDGVARNSQSVDFAGSAVTFTDRRLRSALTEVVTVRNGAP